MSLFLCVAVVVGLYVRAGRRLSLDRLISGSLLLCSARSAFCLALARPSLAADVALPRRLHLGRRAGRAGARAGLGRSPTTCSRRARRGACSASSAPARPPGATAGGFVPARLARRFGAESLLGVMALCLLAGDADREELWRTRPAALRHAGGRAVDRGRGAARQPADGDGLGPPAGDQPRSWCCRPSSPPSRAGSSRAIAQQALVTKDAMAAFFGTFNGWVGVLCVATQLLFTASVLRRLKDSGPCCSCCRWCCSRARRGPLGFAHAGGGRARPRARTR